MTFDRPITQIHKSPFELGFTKMRCSLAQRSFLLVTEAGISISLTFHHPQHKLQRIPSGSSTKGQAHYKKLPLHKAFCISPQRPGLQDLVFRAHCGFTLLFFFFLILFSIWGVKWITQNWFIHFFSVDTHWKTLEQGRFALLQSPTNSKDSQ